MILCSARPGPARKQQPPAPNTTRQQSAAAGSRAPPFRAPIPQEQRVADFRCIQTTHHFCTPTVPAPPATSLQVTPSSGSRVAASAMTLLHPAPAGSGMMRRSSGAQGMSPLLSTPCWPLVASEWAATPKLHSHRDPWAGRRQTGAASLLQNMFSQCFVLSDGL